MVAWGTILKILPTAQIFNWMRTRFSKKTAKIILTDYEWIESDKKIQRTLNRIIKLKIKSKKIDFSIKHRFKKGSQLEKISKEKGIEFKAYISQTINGRNERSRQIIGAIEFLTDVNFINDLFGRGFSEQEFKEILKNTIEYFYYNKGVMGQGFKKIDLWVDGKESIHSSAWVTLDEYAKITSEIDSINIHNSGNFRDINIFTIPKKLLISRIISAIAINSEYYGNEPVQHSLFMWTYGDG